MSELFFDFGDVTPEDARRVWAEMQTRGYGQLESTDAAGQAGAWISTQFLAFVIQALRHLGLVDGEGRPLGRLFVPYAVDEKLSPAVVLRELWNERAKDWAVIESPANYAITMATLMEFFKANDRARTAPILSLGSGPGIYETFLGSLLLQMPQTSHVKVICVDYAERMTQKHKHLLSQLRTVVEGSTQRMKNVMPVTDDMTNLQSFDAGTMDQIICNNSLQWVADWRKVIAEMRRVINPKGLGYVYLFVHPYRMAIGDVDQGKAVIELPEVPVEELMDELERQRFALQHVRQIAGTPGTGQSGTKTNRIFLLARFRHDGNFTSWREKQIESRLGIFRMKDPADDEG